MEKYKYYQDQKVTIWQRVYFEVAAEDKQKADEIVRSWEGKDMTAFEEEGKVEFIGMETMFDTVEMLSSEDNQFNSTIEVYDEEWELISAN